VIRFSAPVRATLRFVLAVKIKPQNDYLFSLSKIIIENLRFVKLLLSFLFKIEDRKINCPPYFTSYIKPRFD